MNPIENIVASLALAKRFRDAGIEFKDSVYVWARFGQKWSLIARGKLSNIADEIIPAPTMREVLDLLPDENRINERQRLLRRQLFRTQRR